MFSERWEFSFVILILDNPEKILRLLDALRAAAPFEVELAPTVLKQLQDIAASLTPIWRIAHIGTAQNEEAQAEG
jgi:hypothetical protein